MCREVCVIFQREKMEFFFTFLSFSTKFRGARRPDMRTEQQEYVASIRVPETTCVVIFPSQQLRVYSDLIRKFISLSLDLEASS